MPNNDDSPVSPEEKLWNMVNDILTSYLKSKLKDIQDQYEPKPYEDFGEGI